MSPHARARLGAGLVLAGVVFAQAAIVGLAGAGLSPPPPTPVDGSLSPFPSTLRTPGDAARPPQVSAPSAILADAETGALLFAKGPDDPRPIASLTKVMTALLVLERGDLDRIVTIDDRAVFEPDDYGAGSTLGLRAGERLSRRDLLYGLLLGSANDAAVALAIDDAGSEGAFIQVMDRRAAALGMDDTRFFSPNGLDDRGRSTAADLITLTRTALATPGFAEIIATKFHRMPGPGPRERVIQNRDVLLWLYPGAFGVKTGSTSAAGFCLIAGADRDGRRLLAVVLGAPSDAFSDAAALLNYGFAAFRDHTFVQANQPLGSVRLTGGRVIAEAGEDLVALATSAEAGAAEIHATVADRVRFPQAPGTPIGTVVVRSGGREIGSVPLVVASVPAPAPATGPWWARAAGAVARAVGGAVRGLTD